MSKYSNDDMFYETEESTPIDFLKTLSLDDFLKCENTRNILLEEHQQKFEYDLQEDIKEIYEYFLEKFPDDIVFGKDYDSRYSVDLVDIVYNNLYKNYDLTIFYDRPELANNFIS